MRFLVKVNLHFTERVSLMHGNYALVHVTVRYILNQIKCADSMYKTEQKNAQINKDLVQKQKL